MPLRHNIAKKQHRERSQPLERRKWGLLEKKKDYQLRSKDFHRKEAALKLLRKKASERNPDEYHHGMNSQKTDKNGILITDRGNEVLSNSGAKLLKTQDSGYVRTLNGTEQNKIKKLESQLLFESQGNHTIFVDSEEDAKSFSAAKYFDTDPTMVNRRENRLKKSQLEQLDDKVDFMNEDDKEYLERKRMSKFKELKRRMERQQELATVQQEMDLQRELMKKGEKKKVVKDGKVTWKWKNVRKK
uniref:U3 small nucleolar RNA-associated protein 11 n=1 Tax=Blastobotrys adeninivorans TaxID=409370 RepID=A0A060TCM8_BLAAD